MLPRAGDPGRAERDDRGFPVVVLRLQPAVQELVLQKNDGVRNFHGLAQHPVGIRYRGRSHDVQARIMGEQGFQALAVERAGAGGSPAGQAHRDVGGNARAVVMGGRHVDNLVESDRAEVGKLDFHNGLLAHDGGPGHHAGHGVLTDGGVNHPVRE